MSMTYSDEEMREIERDPIRLKAYFWQVAQNMKRMASRRRTKAKKATYEEHYDLIRWANIFDRVSEYILTDIDILVETTVIRNERV